MIYTPLTKKALSLCFTAHKDQLDKSGMPYVFHPFHLAEQMADEYTAIAALLQQMVIPAIPQGLCGFVYTQLSDVEDEINGLYTYDRQVCKVDEAKMQALAQELFQTFEKSFRQ